MNNTNRKEEEPSNSLLVNTWLKTMMNTIRTRMEITNTKEEDMMKRISSKNILKMAD